MKTLSGTEFLRFNMDVEDRTRDRSMALNALRTLEIIAPQLGLPGDYLRDSLRRYLEEKNHFRTLDQAFGLDPIVGSPKKELNDKDADTAYKCFERRLKGKLAKQLEYKGYSKRRLTQIQSRYLFASIHRARQKRGKAGFSAEEKKRLEALLRRGRKALAAMRHEEQISSQ